MPISLPSLPTFNFGPKLSQGDSKMNENFQFSNPIVDSFDKPAQLNPTSIGKPSESTGFTFSRPIELESPFTIPSATINSGTLPQTWDCSSCWVKNPDKEPKCLACETPKTSQESTTPATVANSSSTWKCESCWIQNLASMSKCQACEDPKPGSSSVISTFKSSSSGFGSTFSVPSTSWVCDCCCITNPSDQARCLACEAPKPEASNSSVAGALSTKSAVANAPSSMWNCGDCWTPNPAEKDKCMACEAPNPSKKDLSAGSSSYAPIKTSNNTSSPFLSGSAGFSSTSTPASGFAMPVPHNGPQAVSFGGFKIPTTKPSDSVEAKDRSSGEKVPDSDQSSKVTASKKSSRSTFKFIEDSSCENEPETPSDANGLNSLLSANQQSSENLLDSSKEKTNGTFSFKSGMSQSSQSAFNSKPNAGFSTPVGWECDTCLVKVTGNAQICPACETHRPTKKNTSGLKDPGVFKFSSPIQNSPLAFKFGAPTTVSLSETTTTTSSSFTFSTPISTNSPFSSATAASTTNLKSSAESKPQASEVPATKPSVPEFKFDAPKLPSTDAKTIIPVINLEDKTESSSSDTKEATDLKPVSQSTTSSSVTFAFGASKSLDTTPPIASAANFSAPSENTLSKFPVSQANTNANPLLTVQDVKKLAGNDSTSGQSSFLTGNFKVPSTSTPAATLFSKPAETAPDNQAPKVSEAAKDKKSVSPFGGLSSSTPSLAAASPFGQSVAGSAAPVFDIRESATPKTSAEPLALKSSFVMSTASSSQPTFSFGRSSTSAASSSQQPVASGLLAFQPTASKNEDSKAPSAPTFALSATGTPSTFSFGNQAAPSQQPGASAGFSFFSAASSTAAATTASSGGVFTFGSTASQASKPGGFTFKSFTEEKPNPVSSSSMGFGVPPATTTASSAIFKFGASAPSSATGGFVFGAVKSEPTTTASSGFQFGSGSAPTTTTSVFPGGFQPTQPAAAPASVFQFGAQPSSNPGPALNFGSTNAFAFGAKAEAPSLMPQQPAGAAAPAGGFGTAAMQPMFGSTPSGGFGKTEKTGFNFAAAASGPAPVFQFGGNVEKKPSTQFAFGATSQEAANPNNSFAATPFNMSSTPSFNFGAGPSAGAQPFQFAASTAETGSSAAPRKIRKALRRVPNKH